MEDDAPPPLPVRIGILLVTVALGLGICEGVVRFKSGNAVPHVEIFEVRDGLLRLQPNERLKLMRPDGGRWFLDTDDRGFRASSDSGWLVVGDSQVMGLGVEDDEAFPALLGAINGGVPGYSLDDALALGHAYADQVDGVVVVVNQANDWDEVGRDALDRYQVCGGRLVLLDSPPWRCTWLGSPVTKLQLVHFASLAVLPKVPASPWTTPLQSTSHELAAAVRVFEEEHPGLPVVSVFLPVDYATSEERSTASPFAGKFQGRPWEEPSLNEDMGLDIDLHPTLEDPSNFQTGDYHLSPAGHRAVAEALRGALETGSP